MAKARDIKMRKDDIKMDGVTEYAEGYIVVLGIEEAKNTKRGDRPVITAINEGGFNSTSVDVIELLTWIVKNRPDLIDEAKNAK